jgi:Fur family transcriptional regulator, peroxide stress response regulator
LAPQTTDLTPRLPARRRTTRQLEVTYRVLCDATDHPTPEQVFRAVRLELPDVSRGTVYRNLQKLVADGRAQVVQVSNRSARYDGRVDCHDHFVCSGCAMVIDVGPPGSGRGGVRRRVAGHRVGSHTLTYFGICRDCEAEE